MANRGRLVGDSAGLPRQLPFFRSARDSELSQLLDANPTGMPVGERWLGAVSGMQQPSELELFQALGRIVESMPDWGRCNEVADDYSERLRAVAPKVWHSPLDASRQVNSTLNDIDWDDHPLDSMGPVSPSEGTWWTTPWLSCSYPPTAHTTRGPFLGAPCVAAFGVEDTAYENPWLDPGNPETKLRWRSHPVPDGSRVYEIDSSADWAALVEQYPCELDLRPRERSLKQRVSDGQLFQRTEKPFSCWKQWFPDADRVAVVDWAAVARDWDGVHVTIFGYLASAYAPIETRYGMSTMTGWGPDLTCWLR